MVIMKFGDQYDSINIANHPKNHSNDEKNEFVESACCAHANKISHRKPEIFQDIFPELHPSALQTYQNKNNEK